MDTTNGHFSNGFVWDEYLFANQKRGTEFSIFGAGRSGDYGANTENRDINVNYSIGGTTYSPNDQPYIPTITDQINAFIHGDKSFKNTFSDDSIIILWAGANDAIDALQKGTSVTDKANFVKEKLLEALEQFYQAGGRNFLVPDLPDFSKVPRFINSGSSLPGETTNAFNKAIAEALADFRARHSDTSVYTPDMGGFLDTVMRNPELFGYKNTTDACIKIAACKDAVLSPQTQNEFMFWDEIHPTTRTHHYIANYMREYWLNPELAGFYVTSPEGQYQTERNFFSRYRQNRYRLPQRR